MLLAVFEIKGENGNTITGTAVDDAVPWIERGVCSIAENKHPSKRGGGIVSGFPPPHRAWRESRAQRIFFGTQTGL